MTGKIMVPTLDMTTYVYDLGFIDFNNYNSRTSPGLFQVNIYKNPGPEKLKITIEATI